MLPLMLKLIDRQSITNSSSMAWMKKLQHGWKKSTKQVKIIDDFSLALSKQSFRIEPWHEQLKLWCIKLHCFLEMWLKVVF